jgi:tetratricopeptide (TPR) repeat protein
MPENSNFSIETGADLVPFWRRFPSFFIYPLQAGTLLRLAAYSIFGGLVMAISGIFGSALEYIVWAAFFQYALIVLCRTANGQFDEPDGMEDKKDGSIAQVLRQLGMIGIMGMLESMLNRNFGDIGGGLGWLLTGLLTPACIMIIATHRSLLQALNPAQILHFARTIGSPYLALCFILLSLTGSGHWVQFFLIKHLHSWLLPPLVSFAGFYFGLITYHMTGYAMYQYHEELGLHAAVSFEQAQAKIAPSKVADPVLAQLSALVAEGRMETAIDLLQGELRKRWEDNDLHARYQNLLLAAGKQTLAMHHSREFIYKLVNEKRMFQALDLCEKCLKADPEFKLQDSNQLHELAAAASLAKRHKLALDLMYDFDAKYPGHPHIPSIWLLSAKILGEHVHQPDEAKRILRALQAEYPDHPLVKEAEQQIQMLARLAEVVN